MNSSYSSDCIVSRVVQRASLAELRSAKLTPAGLRFLSGKSPFAADRALGTSWERLKMRITSCFLLTLALIKSVRSQNNIECGIAFKDASISCTRCEGWLLCVPCLLSQEHAIT